MWFIWICKFIKKSSLKLRAFHEFMPKNSTLFKSKWIHNFQIYFSKNNYILMIHFRFYITIIVRFLYNETKLLCVVQLEVFSKCSKFFPRGNGDDTILVRWLLSRCSMKGNYHLIWRCALRDWQFLEIKKKILCCFLLYT